MVRRDRGECDAVQFDILNLVLSDLFLETGCKEQEQDVRLHCYVRTRIVRTVVSHHHITTSSHHRITTPASSHHHLHQSQSYHNLSMYTL